VERLIVVLLLMTAVMSFSNASVAYSQAVDQRCDQTTGCQLALWDSIGAFSPIGQTFVPSYHSPNTNTQLLTGIEVYMTPSVGPDSKSTFEMSIKQLMSGEILSETWFTVKHANSGWVYVLFNPVELVSGETYAFLTRPIRDTNNWGLVSDGRAYSSTYTPGSWMLYGKERDGRVIGNDLAFRTYVMVPEPSSLIACLAGILGIVVIRTKK